MKSGDLKSYRSAGQNGLTFILIFFNLLFLLVPIPAYSAGLKQAEVSPQTFKPVEILKLNWGTGSGQVGLARLPGFTYGPQSFLADEDRNIFYLLDSANSRLLAFDRNRTLINSLATDEMAKDIALDNDGTIYILYTDLNKIIACDFSGLKKAEYLLKDQKSPLKGIHYSREKGLLGETFGGFSFLVEPKTSGRGKQQEAGLKFTGFYRQGSIFLIERKPDSASLKILDSQGNTLRKINIAKKHRKIETVNFLGLDSKKNIYVVVEEERGPKDLKRVIKKLDFSGVILAESEIPYSLLTDTFRDLRLGDSGQVYQILPLPEACLILAWTAEGQPPQGTLEQALSYFQEANKNHFSFKTAESEKIEAQAETIWTAAQPVTPADIINKAQAYANYYHNINSCNITSGTYCEGKLVVTPVNTPGYYTGVRYKWGGFSGLDGYSPSTDCGYSYQSGLNGCKFAGDKNTSTDYGVCCAVGVDCSGFVSQVWGLESHHSTSMLPENDISWLLETKDDLTGGDILDYPGSHVRLFYQRNPDGTFNVYESSANDWKVSNRSYYAYQLTNYSPYRYNLLNHLKTGDGVIAIADGLEIREAPGTSGQQICAAGRGNTGIVVGGPQTVDGLIWYQVQWEAGTGSCGPQPVTGWCPGRHLNWLPAQGNMSLNLSGQRLEERAWIIRLEYARLNLVIARSAPVEAGQYVLLRKAANQAYTTIKEFTEAEIQNNTWTFDDLNLNKSVTYTYRVEARAMDGSLLSQSNEVVLESTRASTNLTPSSFKKSKK